MRRDDTVPHATRRLIWLPRHAEDERRVASGHRVEDDVVAPAARVRELRLLGLRRLVRREDLLEVPLSVRVLDDVHVRMLDRHAVHEDAIVEEIPPVVLERHTTRAREQLTAQIANRDRVDHAAAAHAAADFADVELGVRKLDLQEGGGDLADLRSPEIRARQEQSRADYHEPDREQHDGGDERHELATGLSWI